MMGKHKNRRKYKFLSVNGKTVRAHRFIMEKHLGRKLSITEVVHHKDGNGCNNEISNLEVLEYARHCKIENRRVRPAAKLSINDVKDIRKMLVDGIKKHIIAFAFNIHQRSIRAIETGECWGWV